MEIKVKLDENAIMPTKAHDMDAGFDIYAPEDFVVPKTRIREGESVCNNNVLLVKLIPEIGSATVDTGVHFEVPEGYVGMIKSKSGLNVKHGLIADGVIDAGFTGSIKVKLYNLSNEEYSFKKGDKITQLVILPIPDVTLVRVDEFEETERGNGGFGSSGR